MINKILMLPMPEIDLLKNGQIISKTEDAEKMTAFFNLVINNLFINLLSIAVTAAILYKISPTLAFLQYISIPILLGLYKQFGSKIKNKETLLIKSRDDLYDYLFGLLQGIREIKILGSTYNAFQGFLHYHKIFLNKQKSRNRTSIILGSMNTLISGILQLIFLIFACIEIINGKLSLGMYYAFNSYANRFSNAIMAVGNIGIEFQAMSTASERIVEYYDSACSDNEDKDIIIKNINNINVNDISFGYNSNFVVLRNITFQFDKNTFYVIVGENGCGKSTLLDIIMNFYTPQMGKVLINNIGITDINCKSIFSKIAYIRQNPFFFNMSIADNMRIVDNNITVSKISAVCDIVGMKEYIENLPAKYDTCLGDNGTRFSGGQIHRLALARGLIINADVYILDELTSDLDGENEKIIMDVLTNMTRHGKIIIMVSHKLSSIVKADRILVMKDGTITAAGTHSELISGCEEYIRLYGEEWNHYKDLIKDEK